MRLIAEDGDLEPIGAAVSDHVLDETRADLDHQLEILYKEFPYFHFSKSVFEHNRDVIQTSLQPVKGLHAYAQNRTSAALEIEVGNIQGMPIVVESVTFCDSLTASTDFRIWKS